MLGTANNAAERVGRTRYHKDRLETYFQSVPCPSVEWHADSTHLRTFESVDTSRVSVYVRYNLHDECSTLPMGRASFRPSENAKPETQAKRRFVGVLTGTVIDANSLRDTVGVGVLSSICNAHVALRGGA